MKEFKKIDAILADEPVYRLEQIKKARFDVNVNGYGEITTLPLALRDKLKDLPWLSVEPNTLAESKVDSTKKALLRLSDGQLIETVLMGRENKKGTRQSAERYTICVSSQAGCAMRCAFCATGLVGFRRNLTAEEIVDQYRFWQRYLHLTTPKSLLPRHGRGKLPQGDVVGHQNAEPYQIPGEALRDRNKEGKEDHEDGDAVQEHPHHHEEQHQDDHDAHLAAAEGDECLGDWIHDAHRAGRPGKMPPTEIQSPRDKDGGLAKRS